MIKIYEALLDYRIGAWSMNSSDTAQNIISLFKGYARLVEVTKVCYNKNIQSIVMLFVTVFIFIIY